MTLSIETTDIDFGIDPLARARLDGFCRTTRAEASWRADVLRCWPRAWFGELGHEPRRRRTRLTLDAAATPAWTAYGQQGADGR